MSTFGRDLRYSLRSLRSHPGVTGAALLTLALGIGASLTVFAWINATLFEPNPFADPGRAVYLWSIDRERGSDRGSVSLADFADWREQSRSFEKIAAFERARSTLGGNPPERLQTLAVSADFFAVLGARPLLGRTFLPGEDLGETRAVVLSHELWKGRFGADRGIAGRVVSLDGQPSTVVGVMPDDFWFPSERVKLWTLLDLGSGVSEREAGSATVIGLLRPDTTLGAARAEMQALAQRPEPGGSEASGNGIRVVPISMELLDRGSRMILFLLGLTMVFVLLIACVNVTNLLLARGIARQGELALRVALGARRSQVARQLLTECLVLTLGGGMLGLLGARWGARVLLAAIPRNTPAPETIVDGRVLGLGLLLVLLATLISGLLPALRASRTDPRGALQEAFAGLGGGRSSRRLFKTLVVGEVALALVLLVVSGLMIRTLANLHRLDVGFATRDVLTLRLDLPADRSSSGYQVGSLYEQILERIERLSGVEAASAASHLPFMPGAPSRNLVAEGRPPAPKPHQALFTAVTPDYFRTLDIPVFRGRGLTPHDTMASLPVVLVNDTLARQHWPGEDPLGKRIRLQDAGEPESAGRWLSIVGVVADVRAVHPAFVPRPQVYVPHAQNPLPNMALLLRSSGEPADLMEGVRARLGELDGRLAPYDVHGLRELMENLLAVPRAFAGLLATLSALALLLACTGIYAVTAFSVRQRTHEIGVRMALGARRGDVLRLVVREGAKLVTLGALFGSAAGFVLGRAMSRLFLGVGAGDPLTYASVIALLLAVGVLANYLPARHAASTRPMEALRAE